MTYVITEPCIGEKNGACVDVCPAACIHTTPDAQQNYIDPDVCIECEQCVLVCPVDAIFLDSEVPSEWQNYIELNAAFFDANKAGHQLSADEALRMVSAAQTYATRAGCAVAIAVLNANGETLACSAMNGCDAATLEAATRKAYTALVYQIPSHELRKGSPPPWIATAGIDSTRVLMVSGGLPLVEGSAVLGAVGVAGGSGADQDLLCCQAAVARQSNAH